MKSVGAPSPASAVSVAGRKRSAADDRAALIASFTREDIEERHVCPFCGADRFSYAYNREIYGYEAKFMCGLRVRVRRWVTVKSDCSAGVLPGYEQAVWAHLINNTAERFAEKTMNRMEAGDRVDPPSRIANQGE